ncbi:MAG: 3-deoxy-8-phosphooctulonate synthase, partial [Gammaproteobacteria bacterium]
MRLRDFDVGLEHPLFLIAGPCVVESEEFVIDVAGRLKELTAALEMSFVFKASYDKANRTSHESFRGIGVEAGL